MAEIVAEVSRIAAQDTHSETEVERSILRLVESIQAECDPFVCVAPKEWVSSLEAHTVLAVVEGELDETLKLLRASQWGPEMGVDSERHCQSCGRPESNHSDYTKHCAIRSWLERFPVQR